MTSNYYFENGKFDRSAVGMGSMVLNGPDPDASRPEREDLPRERQVFLVHGRDRQAVRAMWEFLQDLDLQPWDWESVARATGKAAPHTLDVVRLGFSKAAAVLVLLTADDVAQLHGSLREAGDASYEAVPTGQPRANVLFEAGLAMATHPDRTLLVRIGKVRPFSDVHGLDFVILDGSSAKLNIIANRLQQAGCRVDMSGTRWLQTDLFTSLNALTR